MSERETFIARWSRRKRAATEEADVTQAPAPADQSARESKQDASEQDANVNDTSATPIGTSEPPFDVSKLPPLDSIGADTDIRSFLAPGVPPELTHAALRRAWAADPTIRDFVGLAENAWDFNAPNAVPGFGALEMTDELRRQIAQMVGRSLTATEADRADEPGAPAETTAESRPATAETPAPSNSEIPQAEFVNSDAESHNLSQIDQDYGASQHSSETSKDIQLVVKRPHGRALPK